MHVLKRNGKEQTVNLNKVTERIKRLSKDLEIDAISVAQKVISTIYNGITTTEIDTYLAEQAAVLTAIHPDYSKLAARIAISNHQKDTKDFRETMEDLYAAGYLCDEYIEKVRKYNGNLESIINYAYDDEFEYFGFKTLYKSYLMKIDGKVVERPQHLYMRVALAIADDNIESVKELYKLLAHHKYTHATPTLFNAGMKTQQMSSCYLIAMEDDSIDGIFNTVHDCANISKYAGGIGIHAHNIRAKGTEIKGTNGVSNGLIPMLKVFNEVARYVDQGGGKRRGSFAIYLEPWHADIEDFLKLKKNTTKEELAARDLFLALWVPDLFMQRVEDDADWTLMCPKKCPGLADVYGDEFEALYTKYEQEGRGKKIKARELWALIIDSQIETGVPYMMFKDACNKKSNQKNLGTIKSSNLCTEIVEYSDSNETAVCNLASIALHKFVDEKKKAFDFKELAEITKIAVKNLNNVIDKNFYPTEKTKKSNFKHRPIALGIQGLADTFFLMRYPYDSQEAAQLNKDIFETMYFAALEESCDLAKKTGAYETFKGSPVSKGILQFDMWDDEKKIKLAKLKEKAKTDDSEALMNEIKELETDTLTSRYTAEEWDELRSKVKEFGLKNSLLISPMPTASTASIIGSTEAFECITSNLYNRSVLSGTFTMINSYLVSDLEKIDLWNDKIRNKIISEGGSIQNIPEIPTELKELYKTVWEISQKVIIKMSADRGRYICQSQSMNLWLEKPNFAKVSSMLLYAWKKGLKTGMYYLRSKTKVQAVKVTTDIPQEQLSAEQQLACSLDSPENCISCSS